eukprot:3688831-Pyramimonas_sp.AAC.1
MHVCPLPLWLPGSRPKRGGGRKELNIAPAAGLLSVAAHGPSPETRFTRSPNACMEVPSRRLSMHAVRDPPLSREHSYER